MINTDNYNTKELSIAKSETFKNPRKRLHIPRPNAKDLSVDFHLRSRDIKFLCNFIKGTGFYVEELEKHIHEELTDFWQIREHALRIITDVMVQKEEAVAPAAGHQLYEIQMP
jgi:hypothetical protein